MRIIFIVLFFLFAFLPVNAQDDSALFIKAKSEYENGKYSKTIKLLKQVDENNLTSKENAQAELLKYQTYFKMNDIKNAKIALKNAVKYDPYCYEGYIGLAIFAIEDNDTELAKYYFNSAIKISKELAQSDEILFYFAKICILDKDFPLAKKYILQAIEINPDAPEYYLELGKIYLFSNDFFKAINAFEYALTFKNNEYKGELYNYLGVTNFKRNSLPLAYDFFIKALEIEPCNLIYLSNLATVYKAENNAAKYNETVNKIKEQTPETADDYVSLSELYAARKEYSMAREVLNKASYLYPDNLTIKTMLSKLNNL